MRITRNLVACGMAVTALSALGTSHAFAMAPKAPDSTPPVASKPSPDAAIEGVDLVKREVREAAARGGKEALLGIGPWRITYSGDFVANPALHVAMQPEEAFTTVRETETTFIVSLAHPEALFTSLGNLREMGVKIEIRDLNGGEGSGVCSTGVMFFTNGTRTPINLQEIALRDPSALNIAVSPAAAAKFERFENEKAFFSRTSGDATIVTVSLRLKDSGNTYLFNANLPSCGVASVTPAPGAPSAPAAPVTPIAPAPAPKKGQELVEVSREVKTFTIRSRQIHDDSDILEMRNPDVREGCQEAKDKLLRHVLNDAACQARAAELFPVAASSKKLKVGDMIDFAAIEEAQVQGGSQYAICSCKKVQYEGDGDCSYDCAASGSVTCSVPVVTYEVRAK